MHQGSFPVVRSPDMTEGLEMLIRGETRELGDLLATRFLAWELSVREKRGVEERKSYELRTVQTATLAGAKL